MVTETSYAGDVESAKAALDAASAALEAAPANTQQSEVVEQTIVVEEETAVETALYAAAANQCGENVTWTLSDMGLLTISGTGSMYNYTQSNHAPWYDESLRVNDVVIESGITRIGNYAFDECKSIRTVSIADTVNEIGSMRLLTILKIVNICFQKSQFRILYLKSGKVFLDCAVIWKKLI